MLAFKYLAWDVTPHNTGTPTAEDHPIESLPAVDGLFDTHSRQAVMTGEHDEGDSDSDRRVDDDSTRVQRDLGAGHPLSPDDDGLDGDGADADAVADTGGDGGDGVDTDDGESATPETATGESTDVFEPAEQNSDESELDRRSLLLGVGGGAVAASVGWAGVLGFGGGGPDGAEAVAVDYVNAVADNDWAAAGALFHPDSEFAQDSLTYEEYLRDQQQLEGYRSVEPSIDGQYTFRHIANTERAAQFEGESTGFFQGAINLAEIDESKLIIVIASVQAKNLNRTEAQRAYLGDEPTISFSVSVVRDAAGWQIAQVFGNISV